MILIIENQTANPLSYLGGLVSVAASSNLTVPLQYLYPVSRDPQLVSDCALANVNVNDSVTEYTLKDAVNYLNTLALSLGGAVVGYAGANAPSFQITVGGKDSSGKSQPARMNKFADLSTNFRNSFQNLTGNATNTVKSGAGTLHGLMINNNSTSGTVKIYDNTSASGTVIATVHMGSDNGGLLGSNSAPGSVFLGPLGLEFSTGLTIVTSGSSSNDVTVLYQ